MINNVTLMGRLTADPTLQTTTDKSTKWSRYCIAVDSKSQNKSTNFINILSWGPSAEFICKYFKKGSLIAIEGYLQARVFEKDGTKKYMCEVVTTNISFTGEKKKESESTGNTDPYDDFGLPF